MWVGKGGLGREGRRDWRGCWWFGPGRGEREGRGWDRGIMW